MSQAPNAKFQINPKFKEPMNEKSGTSEFDAWLFVIWCLLFGI
jgi:hypothetical protein